MDGARLYSHARIGGRKRGRPEIPASGGRLPHNDDFSFKNISQPLITLFMLLDNFGKRDPPKKRKSPRIINPKRFLRIERNALQPCFFFFFILKSRKCGNSTR